MDAPRQNSSPNADHLLPHSTVANSNLPILSPESCSEVFLEILPQIHLITHIALLKPGGSTGKLCSVLLSCSQYSLV